MKVEGQYSGKGLFIRNKLIVHQNEAEDKVMNLASRTVIVLAYCSEESAATEPNNAAPAAKTPKGLNNDLRAIP